MKLDQCFSFGKHKFEQLEDVIHDDPRYIAWCVENDVVEFHEEALELIERLGII